MQHPFAAHIQQHFPQLFKKEFLVAVSGGLDSVVLIHLLQGLGIRFQMAHCNFNLRAAESDGDEQFVIELSKNLDIRVHSKHFQTKEFASKHGISTQMAARDLRYVWFLQLLEEQELNAVLTAHHLDDQIETFLINLNRATGLSGLSGITEQTDQILRPLLPFSKEQIFQFAQENKLSWREDSSNKSDDYQRNHLRNKVLPLLHEALPQLKGNFSKTLDHLKAVECIVDDAVVRFRESVTTTNSTGIDLHIDEVKGYPNFQKYLFYLLRDYGFSNVEEVEQLMDTTTGKFLHNEHYIILKDRELLRLEKTQTVLTKKWYILPETTSIALTDSKLILETIQTTDPIGFVESHIDKNVLLLDKERLEYPLTLRAWDTGDRMEPFGMKGSQLVSDILTNKKLSRMEKQRVLVLFSGDKLLWIPAIRSSKHLTVKPATKEILKIIWNT
jgi:tRNA(Ile)-lysidine synthase